MSECPPVPSLADARGKLEGWRRHYNEDRPHGAIRYIVLIAMHFPDDAAGRSS
ncbi:integrase core domain-containing protein [Stappia sp. ICDLI1TA098]